MNDVEKIEINDWFVREDYPTIMGGWVVRYKIRMRNYNGEVNASRGGVGITGHWPVVSSDTFVNCLRDVIDRAVWQHKHLEKSRNNHPLTDIPVFFVRKEEKDEVSSI